MPCLDVLLNSKPQLSFVCTIAENSASNDKSGSVAGGRSCKKEKKVFKLNLLETTQLLLITMFVSRRLALLGEC